MSYASNLLNADYEDSVSFAVDFSIALLPYGDRYAILLYVLPGWIPDLR